MSLNGLRKPDMPDLSEPTEPQYECCDKENDGVAGDTVTKMEDNGTGGGSGSANKRASQDDVTETPEKKKKTSDDTQQESNEEEMQSPPSQQTGAGSGARTRRFPLRFPLRMARREKLRRYNLNVRAQLYRDVRRPGMDHSALFKHIMLLRGNLEARRAIVRDCVKESLRFKRRRLAGLLEAYSASLKEKPRRAKSPVEVLSPQHLPLTYDAEIPEPSARRSGYSPTIKVELPAHAKLQYIKVSGSLNVELHIGSDILWFCGD